MTPGEWAAAALVAYFVGKEIIHRIKRSRRRFAQACKALEKASR